MRSRFVALVLLTVVAAPHLALAHGTERHYGDPFEKPAASPPSPAFSILVIESSLSAIRRTLEGRGEEDPEERLQRIERFTASLLYTTSDTERPESEFTSFASALEGGAPAIRHALSSSSPGDALSAVDALEASFASSKRLYQSRPQDG